jgi:hypothetical protein
MKKSLWVLAVIAMLSGCASQKAATKEDVTRLNESKGGAESAIKELRDLRVEKSKLEAEAEKQEKEKPNDGQ